MRVLSTRAHGAVDYAVGVLLVAAPWLLGFAAGGAETWIPVVLGASALAYSAATDYELGLLKRLQVPIHLWADGLIGLTLAVSPWLFAFDDDVWIPHLIIGLGVMAAAFLTDTIPAYERRGADRAAG